jgi:CBS domain-containing protein
MARIADVMSLRVLTVTPDETVQLAIARMLEENVGSVAVCEGNRLVGIFTERDVLRLAGDGTDFDATRVDEVMTAAPVTIAPEDDILAASDVMGRHGVRHVPVAVGEQVLGIVGIRDVVRVLLERAYRSHDDDAHATARDLLRSGEVPLSSSVEGA